MIMSDSTIRERIINDEMIVGWAQSEKGDGKISYGITAYGYDMRVSREFKVFQKPYWDNYMMKQPNLGKSIDPKASIDGLMEYVEADEIWLQPNEFALCRSVEWFNMPRDVVGWVVGKSTYARCGLIVNCTPLEPEWRGHLTIEISNTAPLPIRIYAMEGIAQVGFHFGDKVCETSYKDKSGKYQNQYGVVGPKM
jgi:dCTP deaminase